MLRVNMCECILSHCVRRQLEQRVAQLGMGLHGNGDIPLSQMTSGGTEVGIHQVHNLCQLRRERETDTEERKGDCYTSFMPNLM